jgi:hypothetical protein
MGVVLAIYFSRLSAAAEARHAADGAISVGRFGIGGSRSVVARLSALFALDAFGGGFVVQSLAAYWFHLRFGVDAAALGGIFFGANAFAGISAYWRLAWLRALASSERWSSPTFHRMCS